MLFLIIFAFLGGLITIASPCILPILPLLLSSSVDGGQKRPMGVVVGFGISFTFFTLFLATIVRATGISADLLRMVAVIVVLLFGLVMLIPPLQLWWELFASRLAGRGGIKTNRSDFFGGFVMGLSLGLLWAPCVGPILASVITIAATGQVTSTAVFVTLTYSLGTALPMLAIMYGGKKVMQVMPVLKQNSTRVQRFFGLIMVFMAIAIYFNLDRRFQTIVLELFPNYGTGLTALEDNDLINKQLSGIFMNDTNSSNKSVDRDVKAHAPELEGELNWINSTPLKLENLRGQVVLVDFWTYTCVNCIRTLPHINSWHETYSDKGLVIIGVHAPEFEFEKNEANVKQAMIDFGIKYPVVQDNDFTVWRAYNNRYWPAKYLIDAQGRIRYTHFGEGKYQETEAMIRQLLQEAGREVANTSKSLDDYKHQTKTPETYLGYKRIQGLVPEDQIVEDKLKLYQWPESLKLNTFGLQGEWVINAEYAKPQPGSKLRFRFNAKEVNLVMRSDKPQTMVNIYLDNEPIDASMAGRDVNEAKTVVTTDRLYQLIDLEQPGEHELKMEFIDEGVEVYAFTFG